MTLRLDTQPPAHTTINPLPGTLVHAATENALERLESQILRSYAHNSSLYTSLEQVADLETITNFLRWDAEQPAFSVYLRRWVDKVPACVRHELVDHIAIEENERHSALFREMLAHLEALVPAQPTIDQEQLRRLNYTFSDECAQEQDGGFFLGSFWATEIMSAKRCGQIYGGLRRHGVPDSELKYMHIHFEADAAHGDEVKEHFIKPALQQSPELLGSIRRGVHDRLLRSTDYLMWYEVAVLPDML
jgi:hypothetical protein